MASSVPKASSPEICDTNDTLNVAITSKSAWGSPALASSSPTNEPGEDFISVSFQEVMSEQLAGQLQEQERPQPQPQPEPQPRANSVFEENPDTTSDEVLAQLLQAEFDQEYARVQETATANVKDELANFEVGFDPFSRPIRESTSSDDEDGEEGYDGRINGRINGSSSATKAKRPSARLREWDSFDSKPHVTLGKGGIAKGKTDGKVQLTKHDAVVCGKRNACRIMESKSSIETGDGGGFDMQLSNQVYNALKVHCMSEERRANRLHEKKEKSTAESVMDQSSRLLIFKMINAGFLDTVNGAINTGKEANVYHGVGGNPELKVTQGEVAIKVYKTTLAEFKNRDPYIKDDHRFKDKFSKSNNRKLITLWAEKEMHNLNRIHRCGIPCPQVVCLKKHVLVMTFIGSDGKSAPTLKDAILTNDQLDSAYVNTVALMTKLYNKCELVHADLSEYNLLWFNEKVWVIDVSQSVFPTHPDALGFLLRDCYNITKVHILL